MADAPQPSIDTKESDKKMRERVDKLIAQAASESSGSITLGASRSSTPSTRRSCRSSPQGSRERSASPRPP